MRLCLINLILICTFVSVVGNANTVRCGNESQTFGKIDNLKSALQSKNECTAESLHVSQDELKKSWNETLLGNRAWAGLEYQGFYQMNVEAILLWEEIVAKMNGDAERARDAYRDGKLPKELKNKIKEFKMSVISFISTTVIGDGGNRLSPWSVPSQGWAIPRVHPLFSQILVEYLSTFELVKTKPIRALGIFSTGYNNYEADLNIARSDGLWRGLLFFTQLSPESCGQLGLFPRAARSVLYQFDRMSILFQNQYNQIYWIGQNQTGQLSSKPLVDMSFNYLLSRVRSWVDRPCGDLMNYTDGSTADPYANWPETVIKKFRDILKKT